MRSAHSRAAALGAVGAIAVTGALVGQALAGAGPDKIALVKSGPTTIAPGGLIAYDISVTNTGPGMLPLFRVQVSDPQATTLAEPLDHDIRPGSGRQTVAKLIPPGGTAVWHATRLAPSGDAACGQVLENTALAWLAGNSQNLPGATPTPRHALVTSNVVRTTVACPSPAAPAAPGVTSLSARKSGPTTARRGQRIVYRLRFANNGAQPATDVVVRDVLRSGYALVRRPQGAVLESGSLVWRLGSVAPGQTIEATVPVIIGGRPRQVRCNSVSISAANAPTATGRACTRIVGRHIRRAPVTG